MASSYTSSPRHGDDADLDDHDSLDLDDDDLLDPQSDEDTEDASETEIVKREEEFTEIKEQMYQDKLAQLKKQLQQLQSGTLPEYLKKLKKIEQQYRERLRICDIWQQYELECVERDYIKEKKAAAKEFEEKKIELKEHLIGELEDKKKSIDNERSNMEMTSGDFLEAKSVTTRKLRRRPNDPLPIPEKRRKPAPAQLNYCLDDEEIMEDLKILNKISGKPISRKPQPVPTPISTQEHRFEARIEDGKLFYEEKWFHHGQAVFVESKDFGRVSAVITAVGTQEVWLRKTADHTKLRIYVSQLHKGKYTIKKKS